MVDIKFKQISAVKSDSLWAISDDNRLYCKEQNRDWKGVKEEKMCDVSVGSDGTVVALSEAEGYPYIWDTNLDNFLQMPNPLHLKQISVGDRNNIWGVMNDGTCWKYFKDDEQWKQIRGGDLSGKIKYLSCASDGSCWAVDTNGKCLQWMNNQWLEKGTGMTDISVASNGVVFGVNNGGQVLCWDQKQNKFVQSDKQLPGHLKNITAIDSEHWIGIDDGGNIQSF